jgi:hypothetical protein
MHHNSADIAMFIDFCHDVEINMWLEGAGITLLPGA